MFGCVVAGRPVQTNLQQIDDSHAILELPSASTINHICVFLLGTVPFHEGYGATVHFHWPGKGFQLLGSLTNDKPSAIFRLRGTFTSQASLAHLAFQGNVAAAADPANVTATLGISIEPLHAIQSQLATLPSALTKPARDPTADSAVLAEKIVKHLFNYLSSFTSDNGASLTPTSFVQLGAITRWYESFMSKIRNRGIEFLEKEE